MADQPTGPALDREVERVVFGDDLSAFDAEGNERRERIGSVVAKWCRNIPKETPTDGDWDVFNWGRKLGPDWELRYVWDARGGMCWREVLEQFVAAYRAEPRPFSRDVRLAMGLLPKRCFINDNGERVEVGIWATDGESGVLRYGFARYAEFPSAKDDAERREWAMATAICRAVLNAKGGER